MEYKTLDDRKVGADNSNLQEEDSSEATSDGQDVIQGFDFQALKQRYPAESEALSQFREFLVAETESTSINVWDLQNLGLQSTHMILSARKPLEMMRDISWNMPSWVGPLSRTQVNESISRSIQELYALSNFYQAGSNDLLINGVQVSLSAQRFNIFAVQRLISEELHLHALSETLGLEPSTLSRIPELLSQGIADSIRLNVAMGGSEAILFLNDIEKDVQYRQMSPHIASILQPTWQLHAIRKNIYTVVAFCTIGSPDSINTLTMLYRYYQMNAPIRFGFLMASKSLLTEYSSQQVDQSSLEVDMNSPVRPIEFLKILGFVHKYQERGVTSFMLCYIQHYTPTITLSSWLEFLSNEVGISSKKLEAYLSSPSSLDFVISHIGLISRLGVDLETVTLNGLVFSELNEAMQNLGSEMGLVAAGVESGSITDDTNIFEYQCSQGIAEYHPQILSKTPEFVSMVSMSPSDARSPESLLSSMAFFTEGSDFFSHSYIFLADFSQKMNLRILCQLLGHLSLPSTRVHVEQLRTGSEFSLWFSNAVASLQSYRSPTVSYKVLLGLSKKLSTFLSDLSSVPVSQLNEILREQVSAIDVSLSSFERTAYPPSPFPYSYLLEFLSFRANSNVLFYNGQIIRDMSVLSSSHIVLLESREASRRTGVTGLLEESSQKSTLALLRALSFVRISSESQRQPVQFPKSDLLLRFGTGSVVSVRAVVNPLSEDGQRVIGVISTLLQSLERVVNVEVLLNPDPNIGDFPLKRFYRFVAHEIGGSKSGALFTLLPKKQILTMGVESPESWVVQTRVAQHDLDNIQMSSENVLRTGGVVYAEYHLKHIVVQGSCSDLSTGGPPQGLQLKLSMGKYNTDSLVMQNMYYYQLKANPGVYQISLAPGRGQEIYSILDGSKIPNARAVAGLNLTALVVPNESGIIRDFLGQMTPLYVMKNPGMEGRSILQSNASSSSSAAAAAAEPSESSWLSGMFHRDSKIIKPKVASNETLHVFSLASGHLYERFIKIMMMSVVKRTRNPVKFWFVENFFSPAFKAFIPYYAKELGCDVELVTYKWPVWLHPQTEKQRLIWAYKILFLDVLFPTDLKKIVYIDADQVVRSDIKELFEMDMKGKPYAYTPFCTSNKETLKYQFWQQGFWKNHLEGKPYHISALYVIDLVVFRRLGGGDILRAIYDNLSRDPNSLANLDQDLPNYAQKQLPIFSLPQEWLWCESWCSLDSKPNAKTIDLCNNPMHKEPKLDMARRVISGALFQESWVELDNMVHGVESKYERQSAAPIP